MKKIYICLITALLMSSSLAHSNTNSIAVEHSTLPNGTHKYTVSNYFETFSDIIVKGACESEQITLIASHYSFNLDCKEGSFSHKLTPLYVYSNFIYGFSMEIYTPTVSAKIDSISNSQPYAKKVDHIVSTDEKIVFSRFTLKNYYFPKIFISGTCNDSVIIYDALDRILSLVGSIPCIEGEFEGVLNYTSWELNNGYYAGNAAFGVPMNNNVEVLEIKGANYSGKSITLNLFNSLAQ